MSLQSWELAETWAGLSAAFCLPSQAFVPLLPFTPSLSRGLSVPELCLTQRYKAPEMKRSEPQTEVLLPPAFNPAWKGEDGAKAKHIQPSPEGKGLRRPH